MTELANTINVPIPGSSRFEQDTTLALTRLREALGPSGHPTFSAIALPTSVSGILKATDGVVTGNALTKDTDLKCLVTEI